MQLAVGATEQALSQAEWCNPSEHQKMRTAVIIGTGLGGVASLFDAHQALAQRGRKGVSAFSMPLALANSAAGAVSIRFGFRGPLHAPSSACAAGLQAIGEAMKVLRHGEAEMVLAGGSEAPINPVVLAGFTAAGALSTQYMATPGEASRPFDSTRDGFVLSEGAAMFALETLAHARARGVQPLAELCGFGTSGDAYHITSGARDGEGVARAMQATLDMAGVPASEVGYLSAHATSTPVGDEREYLGIETVYGPSSAVSLSAVKGALGHTQGAAGAVALSQLLMALKTQTIPQTLNTGTLSSVMSTLDIVTKEPRQKVFEYAQINAFGFGGVNCSAVLRKL